MTRSLPLLALAALCACGSDVTITDRASCDGTLNSVETTVDDAFDLDGDGFFDATHPECQETYAAEQLDCDDVDAQVNPGVLEQSCNGVDDDCDQATLDEPDTDEDGFTPCEGDCDDNQPSVGPEEAELLCDGLDNDCDEATIDDPDDDGDGWGACEDCNDSNVDVNPSVAEVVCNGADDDCNEQTLDGDDFDTDGWIHCFDCDDADPLRYPGNSEICEDGIDQDCDEVDDECAPPTWDGVWQTNQVTYSCAIGSVDINFSSVSVADTSPNVAFTFIGGTQPGTLTGTISGGDSFSASLLIPGGCNEDYQLTGSFTSPTTFAGTLTANFTGFCLDCSMQSWTVNGSR